MLKDNIQRLLENESFWDVTLVGSDNGHISTTKVILGAGSPVFERMFFGNFQESSSDAVSFDFCSKVLRVIVWYLHTDELDLDLIYGDEEQTEPKKNDDTETRDRRSVLSVTEARLLVELRSAADFFEIPALAKALTLELCDNMSEDDPFSTCAILDEAFRRGEESGDLWNCATGIMSTHTAEVLNAVDSSEHGVRALSKGSFEKVCQLLLGKFELVEAIAKWVEPREGEDDASDDYLERKEIGMKIAGRVALEDFTPQQLSLVQPSDLFPTERLFAVLSSSVRKESLSPRKQTSFGLFSGSCIFECYVLVGHPNAEVNGIYRHPNFTLQGANMEYRITRGARSDLLLSACADGMEIMTIDVFPGCINGVFSSKYQCEDSNARIYAFQSRSNKTHPPAVPRSSSTALSPAPPSPNVRSNTSGPDRTSSRRQPRRRSRHRRSSASDR